MAVRRQIRRRVRRTRPSVRRSPSSSATAARMDAKQSASGDSGLMIGGIHDPAEKAADQMADRVMRMPAGPVVHRKSDASEEEDKNKEVRRAPKETGEEEVVQTKSAPNAAPVAAGSSTVTASPGASSAIRSMGSGKPLGRSDKAFFEPRFGTDLSPVRVHDSSAADKASRAISARAFSHGKNIAFAKGEYQPGTNKGRHLMAHELAHVVQNGGAARWQVRRAFGKCTSKSDESKIITSHSVKGDKITNPGDKANITLQFGCKPRSFDSQIIDSTGTVMSSQQKTIWNGAFKPTASGNWTTSWDGKRGFAKVGRFMVDDGVYKHRINNLAYAAGKTGDKLAKSGGVLSESPDITVSVRAGVTMKNNQSKHLFDSKGKLKQANIDEMATAIRSEAEGYSNAEQKAIAWSIRNEMVRINSHKVADAKAAFSFADDKKATKVEKKMAAEVLAQNMSKDTTGGAIKWYSPRSMPPHNGKCKTAGGKYDCSGGTVTLTDGSKKSSKAPSFHKYMSFVDITGVKQWNFRFYKL